MKNGLPNSLYVYRLYCDGGVVLRVLAEHNDTAHVWASVLEGRRSENPTLRFWNPEEGGSFTDIMVDPHRVIAVRSEPETRSPIQPHLQEQRRAEENRKRQDGSVPRGGRVTIGKVAPCIAGNMR